MRILLTPLIAMPLLLASTLGFAQTATSADQIVTSLKPTGDLIGGGTRGIRLSVTRAPVSPSPAASGPAMAVTPVVPRSAAAP